MSNQKHNLMNILTYYLIAFFSELLCVFFMVTIFYIVGDGRLGYPDSAPYDAIHVGAAAPSVPQAVSQPFL